MDLIGMLAPWSICHRTGDAGARSCCSLPSTHLGLVASRFRLSLLRAHSQRRKRFVALIFLRIRHANLWCRGRSLRRVCCGVNAAEGPGLFQGGISNLLALGGCLLLFLLLSRLHLHLPIERLPRLLHARVIPVGGIPDVERTLRGTRVATDHGALRLPNIRPELLQPASLPLLVEIEVVAQS